MQVPLREQDASSEVDPLLRLNALPIGMLYLHDLRNRMGPSDHPWVSISARKHQMPVFGFAVDEVGDLLKIHQIQVQCIIDLVTHQQVEMSRQQHSPD